MDKKAIIWYVTNLLDQLHEAECAEWAEHGGADDNPHAAFLPQIDHWERLALANIQPYDDGDDYDYLAALAEFVRVRDAQTKATASKATAYRIFTTQTGKTRDEAAYLYVKAVEDLEKLADRYDTALRKLIAARQEGEKAGHWPKQENF